MTDDTDITRLLTDSAQHFIKDNSNTTEAAVTLGLMAEQGWSSLALTESLGGAGLGIHTVTAMSHLFGQSAYSTPFIGQCVMPAIVLNHANAAATSAALAQTLAEGEQALAFAWQEHIGQLPAPSAATCFTNGKLNGVKQFVAGAAFAEHFLITATDNNETCVVALPKTTEGLAIDIEFDSALGFATLHLNNVSVPDTAILLRGAAATAAINDSLNTAQIALAAELAGLANGCLAQTLDYIKTRTQFKQALGSFQAIRHRCADMFMANKLADSSWQRAARLADKSQSDSVASQTHAAKARCADAAFKVAKESIQMHGAMGFTEEAGIGRYMRAALSLSSWLGSAQQHRHALMQLSLEDA